MNNIILQFVLLFGTLKKKQLWKLMNQVAKNKVKSDGIFKTLMHL